MTAMSETKKAALNGKYAAYPEYKDSGVEWLDYLPLHWKTVSLKMLIDVRDGTHDTPPYVEKSESSFPLVTSKDVTGGKIDLSHCKQISKDDYISIIKRSAVSVGDILMPMIGTVGSPILVKNEANFAIKNLALFKTSNTNNLINKTYLLYFLNSNECSLQFSLESRGGVQNFVSLGTLRNLGLPLVSLDEQTQIAAFLDHETAKIDTLIEKQQQLIELLKEKRQAVISHAVTKGLNPDAPMKDSGVEWLGEVPEHWVVTKTSYCSTSLDAFRIPIEANIRGNRQGQYPYYGASGVIDFVDDYLFDDDLILVCEDGWNLMLRTQPVARFVTGKIWVNNHAHILKPIDIDATLLAECIELTPLNLFISGMRQPKLTADSLKNIPVAYSIDKEEQDELVNFISKYKKQILQLTNKAQHSIELLQERRTALISAAVTGKIDVRNWIAPTTSSDANEAQQEATA
ncbi:restriction endonuclease subunit S [Photobacterium leiognathi]|uniref:restriction endonuclease subunit S n=1 Tax=Photobacterium leiognathi TaxID=553611 RepID=UPI002982300C|nr:restriction endonuclease subunit S [Photobacterium leiognathi]